MINEVNQASQNLVNAHYSLFPTERRLNQVWEISISRGHISQIVHHSHSMGFLTDRGHARAVIHAGIAVSRFPMKSVAGETFPAFPAHAWPAMFCIWQEAHHSYVVSAKHWFMGIEAKRLKCTCTIRSLIFMTNLNFWNNEMLTASFSMHDITLSISAPDVTWRARHGSSVHVERRQTALLGLWSRTPGTRSWLPAAVLLGMQHTLVDMGLNLI